jgi:septal ring factor EnvC (AmiA/AmiB activator)
LEFISSEQKRIVEKLDDCIRRLDEYSRRFDVQDQKLDDQARKLDEQVQKLNDQGRKLVDQRQVLSDYGKTLERRDPLFLSIINGQSEVKQELLKKLEVVEQKFEEHMAAQFEKLNLIVGRFGSQLAHFEEEARDREETAVVQGDEPRRSGEVRGNVV